MRRLIRWGGLLVFAIGQWIVWHETGYRTFSMIGLSQLLVVLGLYWWNLDKEKKEDSTTNGN